MKKDQEQERPDPLKRINVTDAEGKERHLMYSVDAKEIVAAGGKYVSKDDENRARAVQFRKV